MTARVEGRVQGVGFRWWAAAVATELGVTGWVRNADDDRAVELMAEGDPAALDQLEAALAVGPPGARIDRVEASREPAAGGLLRFEIRP